LRKARALERIDDDHPAAATWASADAESTLLENKDDPHSIRVFDPSIKGQTDRFAYRFVKP
jgi:predicted methyltransferase